MLYFRCKYRLVFYKTKFFYSKRCFFALEDFKFAEKSEYNYDSS